MSQNITTTSVPIDACGDSRSRLFPESAIGANSYEWRTEEHNVVVAAAALVVVGRSGVISSALVTSGVISSAFVTSGVMSPKSWARVRATNNAAASTRNERMLAAVMTGVGGLGEGRGGVFLAARLYLSPTSRGALPPATDGNDAKNYRQQ